jgi:hypothetical protein
MDFIYISYNIYLHSCFPNAHFCLSWLTWFFILATTTSYIQGWMMFVWYKMFSAGMDLNICIHWDVFHVHVLVQIQSLSLYSTLFIIDKEFFLNIFVLWTDSTCNILLCVLLCISVCCEQSSTRVEFLCGPTQIIVLCTKFTGMKILNCGVFLSNFRLPCIYLLTMDHFAATQSNDKSIIDNYSGYLWYYEILDIKMVLWILDICLETCSATSIRNNKT